MSIPQKIKQNYGMIQQFHFLVYTQNNWKQKFKHMPYTSVLSVISNSQKVEATQMSIDEWMYKQNVLYTCRGILALKMNDLLIHYTIWMTLEMC